MKSNLKKTSTFLESSNIPIDPGPSSEPATTISSSYTTNSETLLRQSTLESQPSIDSSNSSIYSGTQSQESSSKPFKREPGGSQIPIAGALFIATCLGSPVCAVAGLKLGMFAAVAGGIMGYTTGKMFAEHE